MDSQFSASSSPSGKAEITNSNINISTPERVGLLLGGAALVVYGLSRRSTGGFLLTLLGSGLVHQGGTGYCAAYHALGINTAARSASDKQAGRVARDVHVEKAILINRRPEEIYRFWRSFENLPRFMKNLESVTETGTNRTHWVAKGPTGKFVEWDAEIYNERENEFIAWRSLEDADITNAGSVHFKEAPGGQGTRVEVTLNYNLPGGKFSAAVAQLFGEGPDQLIQEDLRNLKQVLETGEMATVEGQSSGRSAESTGEPQRKGNVETRGGEKIGNKPVTTFEAA